MQDKIQAALRASKADYTEIRLEERESTRVVYRGQDLETASAVIDRGGIVRCLVKDGGWGITTFNDLSDLPHRVQQATEGARAIQGELVELAPTPVSEDAITVSLERDFRGISMTEKRSLAEEYNDILLKFDPRIVDTRATYVDTFSRVTLANSEGTLVEEERPNITVFLMAVARQNGNVQQAFDGVSKVAGYEVVVGHQGLAETVAKRAVDLLSATCRRPISSMPTHRPRR
jgi:TldD protein